MDVERKVSQFFDGHLPFFLSSSTSFFLEVGPLKSSWEGWASAVSFPSEVRDRAPAEIVFGALEP